MRIESAIHGDAPAPDGDRIEQPATDQKQQEHTAEPWEDQKCIERFWSKVDIKSDAECWLWTSGTSGFGYGNFHYGQMSIRAHRFSYQLKHGKLRQHDCVCHECDNPLCVNPAHLWIGTRADNNADKLAKGRNIMPDQKAGELNTFAKLSTPEIMAIRVMARNGMPQARIASFIGVSTALVCQIVNGTRRECETERRVSAAMNACAGIPTEKLEAVVNDGITLDDILIQGSRMTGQRDELLAALKNLLSGLSDDDDEGLLEHVPQVAEARAIIAKVEQS